jgi:hypothetical protein
MKRHITKKKIKDVEVRRRVDSAAYASVDFKSNHKLLAITSQMFAIDATIGFEECIPYRSPMARAIKNYTPGGSYRDIGFSLISCMRLLKAVKLQGRINSSIYQDSIKDNNCGLYYFQALHGTDAGIGQTHRHLSNADKGVSIK